MSRSPRPRFTYGDMLRRPIPGGPARHYGVYLGILRGTEIVFHGVDDPSAPSRGIYEVVSLRDFARGQPCEVVEIEKDDPAAINARVKRLLAERSFRYDVLGGSQARNCEEIARYVAGGKWESQQVRAERGTQAAQWGMVAGAAIFAFSAVVGVVQYLGNRDRKA